MPSQVLGKAAKMPDESDAVRVQIPWSLLLIATERQDNAVAHNEAGIRVNHMQRAEACDAQNLQI